MSRRRPPRITSPPNPGDNRGILRRTLHDSYLVEKFLPHACLAGQDSVPFPDAELERQRRIRGHFGSVLGATRRVPKPTSCSRRPSPERARLGSHCGEAAPPRCRSEIRHRDPALRVPLLQKDVYFARTKTHSSDLIKSTCLVSGEKGENGLPDEPAARVPPGLSMTCRNDHSSWNI